MRFLKIRPSKNGPNICFTHFDLQISFTPQRHAGFGHRNCQNCSAIMVFCRFWLVNALRATAAWHFWISDLQKVVRTWGVLLILTCKCASRHSGVRFLNIWPLKSGPNIWCFTHFALQMCFMPQRHAVFGRRNFQNCSAITGFCRFWLVNALRATAACHFWTDLWKIGLTVWYFVHFDLKLRFAPQRRAIIFICLLNTPAALARLLFEHREPQIIEKIQRFATLLTFCAGLSSFYWLYSHNDLPSADLTSLLCFSILHIIGN